MPTRTTPARAELAPASGPLTRSERISQGVGRAVCEQLASVGYAELKVDRVAELAGVAKTTIYRRWKTKAALVRWALERETSDRIPQPETGDVRSDVTVVITVAIRNIEEPFGRAVSRVMLAERLDPEVRAVGAAARELVELRLRRALQRGIERGELPASSPVEPFVVALSGALHTRYVVREDPLTPAELEALIDFLLRGAGYVPRVRLPLGSLATGSRPARARPR
ncbi:MAG: TetR/AcrR family transcriptional regulator [Polyangiaceae bacterium]|nr:TetR/AcrR family transcriptional regulator [Polyangiaceae bacterium]